MFVRARRQVPVGAENSDRHPGDGTQVNKPEVERVAEEAENGSGGQRPRRLCARIAAEGTPETVADGFPSGDRQAPWRVSFPDGRRRRRGKQR